MKRGIVIMAILSGCAGQPSIVYQKVEIPVVVKEKVDLPQCPDLPYRSVPKDATDAAYLEAVTNSVQILEVCLDADRIAVKDLK